MTEIWNVYDSQGTKLDKTVVRDRDALEKGEFHLSVDVWIVNAQNQFLIQKRTANKKLFPNMWGPSAGGAVLCGENSWQGAFREAEEEIGISLNRDDAKMIHSFIRNSNAFVNVWLVRQDIELKDLKLQKEEVAEVRWATLEEIREMATRNTFVAVTLEGLNACVSALKDVQN